MRLPVTALAALLATVLVAGCAAPQPAADTPPLDGTSWVLSALPGRDLDGGATATLRFEQGRASGSDGCNRYDAGYTAQGGRIEIAVAASTRMACPPAVTEQAAAFAAALAAAKGYRVDGTRLQLLAADGAVRATLAAQSQVLTGSSWRATAIHNGQGAVASLVAGSAVTLRFGTDGLATGSAGCNRYTARYEQDGAQLRLQSAAATRMACPDAGVMAQEQAFLQALQTVATARIDGDRLELRTAAGTLAVALQRDAGG